MSAQDNTENFFKSLTPEEIAEFKRISAKARAKKNYVSPERLAQIKRMIYLCDQNLRITQAEAQALAEEGYELISSNQAEESIGSKNYREETLEDTYKRVTSSEYQKILKDFIEEVKRLKNKK